jgi:formylglycine-generating enzyme required for sulfatase activity
VQDLGRPFRQACRDALEVVAPPERASLWQTLGQIGLDDRPGVGVRDGLPDIDWVEIPSGEFLFGQEPRPESLPIFHVARYPVTNAQFQCFIDDGGFDDPQWWRWPERRDAPEPPDWAHANHPRETVSWFDAVAFCAWLDTRLRDRDERPAGSNVRLPTEQEWEKSARGTDGREFPWGAHYESGRANIDETWGEAGSHYLAQTSAVGIYPQGASPFGVQDMAGNVWEWTLDPDDGPMDSDSVRRVLRGGSWFYNRHVARASYRYHYDPTDRFFNVGFRVVRVSPIP